MKLREMDIILKERLTEQEFKNYGVAVERYGVICCVSGMLFGVFSICIWMFYNV